VRPRRLVLVVGTGTDVGKTWVSARLLTALRARGSRVAARKPAQSFDADDDPAGHDAALLAAASGEDVAEVCRAERCYPVAMAPPMAADVLGRPRLTIAALAEELWWPTEPVDVGLVETAGGVRSPQAHDGDAVDLCGALAPDLVVLVADAGLGTINAVRLSADALAGCDLVVVLNRFDTADDLHARNRAWLQSEGREIHAIPGSEQALTARLLGEI
jgi:dethiobiotin synthetase